MNQHNKVKEGENPRLQFVLPLDSGGRRDMTAAPVIAAQDIAASGDADNTSVQIESSG